MDIKDGLDICIDILKAGGLKNVETEVTIMLMKKRNNIKLNATEQFITNFIINSIKNLE